jgi:hypothetical protein
MGGKRQAGEIACEDTSVVNFFCEPNRPSLAASMFAHSTMNTTLPGHEVFSLSQK